MGDSIKLERYRVTSYRHEGAADGIPPWTGWRNVCPLLLTHGPECAPNCHCRFSKEQSSASAVKEGRIREA